MSDNTVAVSSLLGEGMQDFVDVLEVALADMLVSIEVEIPYSKGDELSVVHENKETSKSWTIGKRERTSELLYQRLLRVD
mmetsp:Transcript_9623/g.17511  ORF Transcript_9623/g.17511 Transcript_9623/m.17511 type:complete len:80 (-) Transcript_9623:184-423(-)